MARKQPRFAARFDANQTFDDDFGDVDKPYIEDSNGNKPDGTSSQSKLKSQSSTTSWLMNPAAALFGSSHASKKKQTLSTIRDTTASAPARFAQQRPRAKTEAPAARTPSPTPQPPNVSSPRHTTTTHGSGMTASESAKSMSSSKKSEGETDQVQQALGELKRLAAEVRGLQASVVVLREEHGALREELRKNQTSTSGSLPVDAMVKFGSGGKQAGKSGGKNSAGFPGQEVSSKDIALMVEAPKPQDSQPPQRRMTPEPLPAGAAPQEQGDIFGGFWEACGFSNTKAIQNGSAPAVAPAKPNSRTGSRGSTQNSARSQGVDGRLPSPPAANPLPEPHMPPPREVGGYVPGERYEDIPYSSSAVRGSSPHIRETPMEMRGSYGGSGGSGRRHPRSDHFDQAQPASDIGGNQGSGHSTPYFSAPGQHANELASVGSSHAERQNSADTDIPQFGTKQRTPSNAPSNATSSGHWQQQLPPAVGLDLGNSLGSSQKPTWRSPQVGGQLVLPFPDHEDEESGASSSPGFATAASSPGWEVQPRPSLSPVPPLQLPTNQTPIEAYSGGPSPAGS